MCGNVADVYENVSLDWTTHCILLIYM